MSDFPKTIQGLSNQRRLPRLGKIRLGIKKKSIKSGKEYPAETDYFVCPPEVEKIYGKTPKALDVYIPVEQQAVAFPQSLKFYGSSIGLKCTGDRIVAKEKQPDGSWKDRDCCDIKPCQNWIAKKCTITGVLNVMLFRVSLGGVYQITMHSVNGIIDVNSGFDYVYSLVDRVAMVPLSLERVHLETHFEGKKQNHWPLKLIFRGDISLLNAIRENKRLVASTQYLLPEAENINPEMDPEARVEVTDLEDVDVNTGVIENAAAESVTEVAETAATCLPATAAASPPPTDADAYWNEIKRLFYDRCLFTTFAAKQTFDAFKNFDINPLQYRVEDFKVQVLMNKFHSAPDREAALEVLKIYEVKK